MCYISSRGNQNNTNRWDPTLIDKHAPTDLYLVNRKNEEIFCIVHGLSEQCLSELIFGQFPSSRFFIRNKKKD